jgi:outer membrane receptor for ferrienterochelin and colicins
VATLRHWRISLVVALACPALQAIAAEPTPAPEALAELSLEDLMQVRIATVYGASRYEQKVTRAPASVTLVTAEEIARFGHRTLAEVMRSIRGLYVSDDRNYSYLGARGFLRPGDYNSRMLVLVDGHRMNDNIYDSAYFGRDGLLAVDVIERVEFVRGPSSSIYGSSAFFGIVNVVTKRGKDVDGAELAVGAQSFGGYDARFTYGGELPNKFEVAVNASYYTSSGHEAIYYPEFDSQNGGMAEDLDGEDAFGVLASAKRGSFTLGMSFLSRTKDVPTASFGTVFNEPEQTTDVRGYIDLKYEREFGPDLRVQARTGYDHYEYYGDYTFDYALPGDPPDLQVLKDETLGSWLSTEWQVTRSLRGRHTLVGGVEYRHSLEQEQLSFPATDPTAYDVNDNRQERMAAVFAQGEFALSDEVLLNAGLRYDHYYASFGGTLNPRVGVIWSPRERTTLKVLYGEAFRAPNVYERFYYPPPGGADELEPETIRTYEVTVEQYLGSRDRLGASVYAYDVTGLLTQLTDANGEIFFDNLTRVRAEGVEIEWERKWKRGALARFSYALQQTEDAATGRMLTSSPRHLAKAALAAPFAGRFDAGVEFHYHGSVDTLSGASAGGFVLGNLNVSARNLPFGLDVSAGIHNLFDKSYGYPGAEDHAQDVIEQDGRTYRLRVMRRF